MSMLTRFGLSLKLTTDKVMFYSALYGFLRGRQEREPMIAEIFQVLNQNVEVKEADVKRNAFLIFLELDKDIQGSYKKLLEKVCINPTEITNIVSEIEWDVVAEAETVYLKDSVLMTFQQTMNNSSGTLSQGEYYTPD